MLPALIARFAQRHPDARFHVAIGNTERANILHCFISKATRDGSKGTAGHPDLIASPWREDELDHRGGAGIIRSPGVT